MSACIRWSLLEIKNYGGEIRLIEFVLFAANLMTGAYRGMKERHRSEEKKKGFEQTQLHLSSRDHISFPFLSSHPSLSHKGE